MVCPPPPCGEGLGVGVDESFHQGLDAQPPEGGLPRRCAPRNDEAERHTHPTISSLRAQRSNPSDGSRPKMDCRVAALLAMRKPWSQHTKKAAVISDRG